MVLSQISSTGAYMGGVYKTRLCLVRPQNKYVQKNLFNESKIFIFLQKKLTLNWLDIEICSMKYLRICQKIILM